MTAFTVIAVRVDVAAGLDVTVAEAVATPSAGTPCVISAAANHRDCKDKCQNWDAPHGGDKTTDDVGAGLTLSVQVGK
jgi:hypothetical protein